MKESEVLKYYAHTDPVNPGKGPDEGANWQLLEGHLKNTAELAQTFTSSFNAGNWGYITGLLHDLGKYSNEFQAYLKRACDIDSHIEQKSGRVDHSTSGAQEIYRLLGLNGKAIAYCIAGHHSGLLDGSGQNGTSLEARLSKATPAINPPGNLLSALPELKQPISMDADSRGFQLYLLIKMLYSSLVDADFLDTEAFMSAEKSLNRGKYPDLNEISNRFWDNLNELHNNSEESPLNRIRQEIYQDCLKTADYNPGLFSLTVPTGGGKTLSSMAFALKHARKFGQKRIIYVIPYTSIIEQNADVFRRFLGEDAILEHHSNFEPQQEDYRTRLASENWDAPVIVTTTVQFYESFFACKSSRNRKLHNVANSVVILDEVQNIPTEYLYPCIELLRELSGNYKCSVVLCSATQPAIHFRNDFKKGLKGVREISSDPKRLSESLRRVETEIISETTNEEIAQRLVGHDRVLCIVNTKKQARELYSLIGCKSGNHHLSTYMCPAHRRKRFKEIRGQLESGQVCRVISTQLIEAGVDIDFPVVYRAMAGLDSIAQAAGRCNREGKLQKGNVYIFKPQDVKLSGHLLHTAQEAIGVIRNSDGEILTLDNIEEYFKNLFWIKGEDQLDKCRIIEDLTAGFGKLNYPFKSIDEKFKIIDNNTMPVVIPYNEDARSLIDSIQYEPFPRTLMRKLQKYTVQLYSYQWQKLFDCGAFEVKEDLFPVLIREDLYSDDLGLNIDCPDLKPEDLMA